MSRKKGDIEIGRRAYEEVLRIFKFPTKARRVMRLSKNIIYEWNEGKTPGGQHLAILHYHGCDVMYILTGKRNISNERGV